MLQSLSIIQELSLQQQEKMTQGGLPLTKTGVGTHVALDIFFRGDSPELITPKQSIAVQRAQFDAYLNKL